jgi:hypothetical protein
VRRCLLALVLTCSLLAAVASPALADDAAIERAWDGDDAKYIKLGKQQDKAVARWRRSGFKRVGPVIRVIDRTRKVLRGTINNVEAQQQSSPTGGEAKRYALLSMKDFGRYLRSMRRAFILNTRYSDGRGNRAASKAERYFKRSGRYSKKARRLFRDAGVPAP